MQVIETPSCGLHCRMVKVMSEYAKHHVKKEQNEMFPKVKPSRLDLAALGAQREARKQELLWHSV